MKYFIYTIIFLALVFAGISFSAIDLQEPFEGESANALIVILANICVIVLMVILLVSRMITARHDN